MSLRVVSEQPGRQDGFGTRTVEQVPGLGRVERLVLSPPLAAPVSEQAIRARAAYLTGVTGGPLTHVLRIERGSEPAVLTPALDGVSVSELLAALEFGTLTLSGEELLELLASLVRAAGELHASLGTLCHGALAPEHVVVMRDGTIRFTGAVFGDALQALQLNRERLWQEFALALPASAGRARFDRRSDVMQLGMLVLSLVERRSLRRNEFPIGYEDLARAAAIDMPGADVVGLRRWLAGTLHLGGRVVFDSAVAAARAFERLLPPEGGDGGPALALRTAIQQLCGRPDSSSATASACEQSTSVKAPGLLPFRDAAFSPEAAPLFLDGSTHLRSGSGPRTGGVRG
jgi:hypothetical protein